VANRCAAAHPFSESCVVSGTEKEPYWRDVGTVDAYWEANIDLTHTEPALNLYDKNWPIWTYQMQLPPAKFVLNEDGRRGGAVQSMVSGGCIISGTTIVDSLLFSSVHIHSQCRVEGAVLLPDVEVQKSARLTRVVVDHGVRIPRGLVAGEDPQEDGRRFYRTEGGVTLITQEMLNRL
jgi:glucose-1-phosphate adenylyltransferase